MNKDVEHLKWLSIGFYVFAGLTAFISCFPFIHLFLGVLMVTGQMNEGHNPPPPFLGWFFIGFASLFILAGWSLAIASVFAGKYLSKRTKYTFIFVMAIISCMFAPFGTIVGVFTIIVLLRDSVKTLFNVNTTANPTDSGFNPPKWNE